MYPDLSLYFFPPVVKREVPTRTERHYRQAIQATTVWQPGHDQINRHEKVSWHRNSVNHVNGIFQTACERVDMSRLNMNKVDYNNIVWWLNFHNHHHCRINLRKRHGNSCGPPNVPANSLSGGCPFNSCLQFCLARWHSPDSLRVVLLWSQMF